MADAPEIKVTRASIKYKGQSTIILENANGLDATLNSDTYKDLRCYGNQYYTGSIHCTNHDVRYGNQHIKGIDGYQPAHYCQGHRSVNSTSVSLARVSTEDLIERTNITRLITTLNNEIAQRNKSYKYNDNITSIVTQTNRHQGEPVVKYQNTVNKEDIVYASAINNLANHIVKIDKDKNQTTITVKSTDVIYASEQNSLVDLLSRVLNDCICYCDCLEYSVCYCYSHCNHY